MKMLIKMAAIVGGAGAVGYMYLKKHPEKIEQMKMMLLDASQMVANNLDEE